MQEEIEQSAGVEKAPKIAKYRPEPKYIDSFSGSNRHERRKSAHDAEKKRRAIEREEKLRRPT